MCSENTFKYDPDIIDYIHTCITKTANKIINFNNSKEISLKLTWRTLSI